MLLDDDQLSLLVDCFRDKLDSILTSMVEAEKTLEQEALLEALEDLWAFIYGDTEDWDQSMGYQVIAEFQKHNNTYFSEDGRSIVLRKKNGRPTSRGSSPPKSEESEVSGSLPKSSVNTDLCEVCKLRPWCCGWTQPVQNRPLPTQITLHTLGGSNVLRPCMSEGADALLTSSLFGFLNESADDPNKYDDRTVLTANNVLKYCNLKGLLTEGVEHYQICVSDRPRPLDPGDFIMTESWAEPWHATLTLIRKRDYFIDIDENDDAWNHKDTTRFHETKLCKECANLVQNEHGQLRCQPASMSMSGAASSTD